MTANSDLQLSCLCLDLRRVLQPDWCMTELMSVVAAIIECGESMLEYVDPSEQRRVMLDPNYNL